MDLLGQLGQLASQTEANLWTAAALFGAAQGVLLLAFFNVVGIGAPLSYAAEFVRYWTRLIGVAGAILSLSSALMSLVLAQRRAAWISKARQLQSELKIPEELAPWTFPAPPWPWRWSRWWARWWARWRPGWWARWFSPGSSGVAFLIVVWGVFFSTWIIVLLGSM